MTLETKIAMVKHLSDEESDETILAFLEFAGNDLCASFIPNATEAERERFLTVNVTAQIKAAAYYLNKKGWDFESSHSENGVSRVYESGDLPDSILRMIVAPARVVR